MLEHIYMTLVSEVHMLGHNLYTSLAFKGLMKKENLLQSYQF